MPILDKNREKQLFMSVFELYYTYYKCPFVDKNNENRLDTCVFRYPYFYPILSKNNCYLDKKREKRLVTCITLKRCIIPVFLVCHQCGIGGINPIMTHFIHAIQCCGMLIDDSPHFRVG